MILIIMMTMMKTENEGRIATQVERIKLCPFMSQAFYPRGNDWPRVKLPKGSCPKDILSI